MAQSVRSKHGRLTWQGIAMAKETQVKKRIDQILDDTRRLSGALSPARWIALFALSLPPAYLLTAVQLVPAQAQTETNRYQAWLQEVSYIITAPEKAAFNNLPTDTERDRFVEQFWEQRNPTPGSSSNPFKEEYYRRLAYANEHFAGDIPGWKTDRGRIYITYGPPDEIESHPAGTPPFDHWRYYHLDGLGQNVDFAFVDRKGDGNYSIGSHPPAIQESGFSQSSSFSAPQRIRVGANVQAANLINKVDPVYPPLAEQARIQGTVRFTVIIGKDGRFANIQLVSGHPLLVQAAKDALDQYVYKPTLLNGQPVEVVTQVDVNFALQ
jgi:TonB family protein